MISEHERFQLEQMLAHSTCVDHTKDIRDAKHSAEIRRCVLRIMELKLEHQDMRKENYDDFVNVVLAECAFLFHNYMDLYNVIMKEDINASLMLDLLQVLKQIEDGSLDQHEGSFLVGKRLKEIYVDSTLAKSIKSDNEHAHTFKPHTPLSWKDYKNNKALNI
jgi:hypothetical protein